MNKFLKHVEECQKVNGAYVEFSGYNISKVTPQLTTCDHVGKKFYAFVYPDGLTNFTKEDKDQNILPYSKGYRPSHAKNIQQSVNKSTKNLDYEICEKLEDFNFDSISSIAFAHFDLLLYIPTKFALEKIWDKMEYGSTIFFSNVYLGKNGSNQAIREFLTEKESEIITGRQMTVQGSIETELAVKCYNKTKKVDISVDNSKPILVATVCKSGGIYDATYVNNLANNIKKNSSLPIKFVCLTDNPHSIDSNLVDLIIPLQDDLPGWWSKMELFNKDTFPENMQIFYFDLDTIIIDNIDKFFMYNGNFAALRDFYHLINMGSGLMSWKVTQLTHKIYDNFMKNKKGVISNVIEGDQKWIEMNLPKNYIEYIQDYYPKEVVSLKKHCMKNNTYTFPDNSAIVCFHGEPRLHNLAKTTPLIGQYFSHK